MHSLGTSHPDQGRREREGEGVKEGEKGERGRGGGGEGGGVKEREGG